MNFRQHYLLAENLYYKTDTGTLFYKDVDNEPANLNEPSQTPGLNDSIVATKKLNQWNTLFGNHSTAVRKGASKNQVYIGYIITEDKELREEIYAILKGSGNFYDYTNPNDYDYNKQYNFRKPLIQHTDVQQRLDTDSNYSEADLKKVKYAYRNDINTAEREAIYGQYSTGTISIERKKIKGWKREHGSVSWLDEGLTEEQLLPILQFVEHTLKIPLSLRYYIFELPNHVSLDDINNQAIKLNASPYKDIPAFRILSTTIKRLLAQYDNEDHTFNKDDVIDQIYRVTNILAKEDNIVANAPSAFRYLQNTGKLTKIESNKDRIKGSIHQGFDANKITFDSMPTKHNSDEALYHHYFNSLKQEDYLHLISDSINWSYNNRPTELTDKNKIVVMYPASRSRHVKHIADMVASKYSSISAIEVAKARLFYADVEKLINYRSLLKRAIASLTSANDNTDTDTIGDDDEREIADDTSTEGIIQSIEKQKPEIKELFENIIRSGAQKWLETYKYKGQEISTAQHSREVRLLTIISNTSPKLLKQFIESLQNFLQTKLDVNKIFHPADRLFRYLYSHHNYPSAVEEYNENNDVQFLVVDDNINSGDIYKQVGVENMPLDRIHFWFLICRFKYASILASSNNISNSPLRIQQSHAVPTRH